MRPNKCGHRGLAGLDGARKRRGLSEVCPESSCQLGDQRESRCPACVQIATVSPLEDYIWWVSGRKGRNNWWCAICGEKYDWKQPNRLLVVQTGESIDQAKVLKAHAVPQGLCENLINALKLLANQQEDGDGLLQNIVTNFGKGSREGLTEGLRKFIRD